MHQGVPVREVHGAPVLWTLLATLALSLVACVLGAMAGVTTDVRTMFRRPTIHLRRRSHASYREPPRGDGEQPLPCELHAPA
jgi:hypothetical protein